MAAVKRYWRQILTTACGSASIAEVPKTSVGKFSKRTMREAYADGDYEIIEVR